MGNQNERFEPSRAQGACSYSRPVDFRRLNERERGGERLTDDDGGCVRNTHTHAVIDVIIKMDLEYRCD